MYREHRMTFISSLFSVSSMCVNEFDMFRFILSTKSLLSLAIRIEQNVKNARDNSSKSDDKLLQYVTKGNGEGSAGCKVNKVCNI